MKNQPKRVVVIGAAGDMIGEAIKKMVRYEPDLHFTLSDINTAKLAALASSLPQGRATTARVDLFDAAALTAAVEGADLVINAAGPYMRTAQPVLDVCLATGVDYLDIDDDNSSTIHSMSQDQRAREAGIACYIGCGASPGLSNVFAGDVAGRLDTVETLDAVWCSGDEGEKPFAPAVLEHLLHACAGPIETWRDGKATTVEAYVASEVWPMGRALGDFRIYEIGHPESVTLPRRYPDARSIRCLGGFHPQSVNGLMKGVAKAVHEGRMTMDEGVAFLQDILAGGKGSVQGWRAAWSGMRRQVKDKESSWGTLLRFVADSLRGHHPPFLGGLVARATGFKDGKPVTLYKRGFADATKPGSWDSMAAATGACIAAFAVLALRDAGRHVGVLSPEDWVVPQEFYDQLGAHGAPLDHTIEDGYHFPDEASRRAVEGPAGGSPRDAAIGE
ncbi:saccharopine dehydrogenase [Streptomyces sp. R302]|nr:saccharopine dehydrogenase [Streptomyces sp. R301]NML83358.1 saccharopine dehydrogenase [Streptomyces sp. R302]